MVMLNADSQRELDQTLIAFRSTFAFEEQLSAKHLGELYPHGYRDYD